MINLILMSIFISYFLVYDFFFEEKYIAGLIISIVFSILNIFIIKKYMPKNIQFENNINTQNIISLMGILTLFTVMYINVSSWVPFQNIDWLIFLNIISFFALYLFHFCMAQASVKRKEKFRLLKSYFFIGITIIIEKIILAMIFFALSWGAL